MFLRTRPHSQSQDKDKAIFLCSPARDSWRCAWPFWLRLRPWARRKPVGSRSKTTRKKTIVVQEFIAPQREEGDRKAIQAAERASHSVSFRTTPGIKNYEICDARGNPLASGPLSCKKDSQSFSITATPQGKVTVMPVVEAKKP